MAVRGDLRQGRRLEEIEPVPERRQGVAGLRIGVLLVESGDQRTHRKGRGKILGGLRAADPFTQLFH